jgi:SAM-dependent methyltransferase/DNA-binding transcriptional ArsR family regulator
MNGVEPLDRQTAETYAAWFKALADGTRVQVVSLLARAGRPLTVKEIVAAVPVGQSTVSEHLRQLAVVGFVLAEERGTSRLYRINGNCVSCFPTAADLVMGKPSPDREEVRAAVAARYAGLARAAQAGQQVTDDPGEFAAGGFGPGGYPDVAGLPEGAVRASLGCGNPVAVADLRPGETVLDLGCGGGIDVLLSARRVGPSGRAYGLDMTEEMLDLARTHAREAGALNAEFLRGHIEAIPLPDSSVDVVISNCVINLSTDRGAVFAESFRVLRPGGRLGISDILAEDRLTEAEQIERGGQVGCIAGAPSFAEYRAGMAAAGFTSIAITPTHQVAEGVHAAIIRAVRS